MFSPLGVGIIFFGDAMKLISILSNDHYMVLSSTKNSGFYRYMDKRTFDNIKKSKYFLCTNVGNDHYWILNRYEMK